MAAITIYGEIILRKNTKNSNVKVVTYFEKLSKVKSDQDVKKHQMFILNGIYLEYCTQYTPDSIC